MTDNREDNHERGGAEDNDDLLRSAAAVAGIGISAAVVLRSAKSVERPETSEPVQPKSGWGGDESSGRTKTAAAAPAAPRSAGDEKMGLQEVEKETTSIIQGKSALKGRLWRPTKPGAVGTGAPNIEEEEAKKDSPSILQGKPFLKGRLEYSTKPGAVGTRAPNIEEEEVRKGSPSILQGKSALKERLWRPTKPSAVGTGAPNIEEEEVKKDSPSILQGKPFLKGRLEYSTKPGAVGTRAPNIEEEEVKKGSPSILQGKSVLKGRLKRSTKPGAVGAGASNSEDKEDENESLSNIQNTGKSAIEIAFDPSEHSTEGNGTTQDQIVLPNSEPIAPRTQLSRGSRNVPGIGSDRPAWDSQIATRDENAFDAYVVKECGVATENYKPGGKIDEYPVTLSTSVYMGEIVPDENEKESRNHALADEERRKRQKCNIIIGAAIFAAVAAAVVVTVVMLTRRKGKNGAGDGALQDSVEPTLSVTLSPVLQPSMQPSIRGCGPAPRPTIEQELRDLICESLPSACKSLSDEASPQCAALTWLGSNDKILSYSDMKKKQRFALATIFYSTEGLEKDRKWMDPGLNECVWTRVVCNNHGVTWVNLGTSFHNVTTNWWDYRPALLSGGTIPREIALLNDTLEYLYIDGSSLTETIPSEITLLKSLKYLLLDINNLSGQIPTFIGDLTGLTYLGVENNILTGKIPESIGNLTELNQLYMFNNLLKGEIPSSVTNLKNLNYAWLNDNLLTGTIPLLPSPSLTVYFLQRNNFTGAVPSEFCQGRYVPRLWADCMSIDDQLPEVACDCCDNCFNDDVEYRHECYDWNADIFAFRECCDPTENCCKWNSTSNQHDVCIPEQYRCLNWDPNEERYFCCKWDEAANGYVTDCYFW